MTSVKTDEDLPLSVCEAIRAAGYVCNTVHEQRWGGMHDAELWQNVVAEERFFVTGDLDFSDARRFAPGTHFGILVLRPGRESIQAYGRLMSTVMSRWQLTAFAGCLVVATEANVRVRRPKGGG